MFELINYLVYKYVMHIVVFYYCNIMISDFLLDLKKNKTN